MTKRSQIDRPFAGDGPGAAGLLTARGARTSHAAVVARQLGKVCLVGCDALQIDLALREVRLGERRLAEGSVLTLDGELLARWGTPKCRSCHAVSGDSEGNVYFVQPLSSEGSKGRRIVKYIRK